MSLQNIKFLLYLIPTNETIYISKSFMVLKYHKDFNCHFCSPTEREHKFIAHFRFLGIKSTAAVPQTHMESLKNMIVFFLMSQMNILLIHETKTTDDHCTASSGYGIPATNNIYICTV